MYGMKPRFAVMLALVVAVPVQAQEAARNVEIHGFGNWSYGKTNDNVFLAGSRQGDYRRVAMTLNVSKSIDDKLSIHTQGEIREDEDDAHVSLSYAFADYRVSDQLSLRAGQVKHPFGLYTEVFAVGTLRPFIDLPQGFYGPVGFAGESYRGLGLSGVAEAGAWTMNYDLYGGGNDLKKFAVPESFYAGRPLDEVGEELELQSTRDVVGGRIVLHTPIPGLSVGSSSYTGILNEAAANRRTVIAGQFSYRTDVLTVESEAAYENQVRDERAKGGYVLAAYRVTPEWQVAAQFNGLQNTFYGADVTSAPSLQDHREVAFALDRWMSRSFVLKAEYHLVSGNRFAMPHPEELIETVADHELHTKTHLVQFGAQFTF